MPACVRQECETRPLGTCFGQGAETILLFLDRFLEQLAGNKLSHLAGGNGNVFTRTGIASFARSTVDDFEAAKAGEAYGFSGGKGIFQGRDDGVQGMVRLRLGGQAGLGVDLVNKFRFGH